MLSLWDESIAFFGMLGCYKPQAKDTDKGTILELYNGKKKFYRTTKGINKSHIEILSTS